MARTIITHVGTSLLDSKALQNPTEHGYSDADVKRLKDSFKDDVPASEDDIKRATAGLVVGLSYYWDAKHHTAQESRKASPGEIASLSLLKLSDADRVVLLRTETHAGDFCAEVLRRVLTSEVLQSALISEKTVGVVPRFKVVTVVAEGLKVTDGGSGDAEEGSATAFVRKGLVGYINRVLEEYDDLKETDGARLEFNVTGGYKGMVPIARDMALLLPAMCSTLHCRLYYLYQASDDIIEYGILPVRFPWNKVPSDQLEKANQPGGADDAGFGEVVDPRFEVYFDRDSAPGKVRLTALGTVVWTIHSRFYP